ncbi:RNA-binding protein 42 [Araneus ventricosus]|uniref:RNA-binding protein 42 n=1 Tax=Araneus ventricosus TaxID=182803 RepID=A0A4Y2MQ91_ARAVE|nr:RNA-binding protein 42 [Araneus ventricosus]GBN28524.1 RNA-binding protein 42 [Araneus ventricosus]GBO12919.1 RNA-binding protein 42 [Araneus ventricosus]GBO12922.1 RNA-binding protein 42 [Araneus ventricosus]
MALMSEERRKEMEEEMSRFELEIAAPGETKVGSSSNGTGVAKPLSPPPPPPAVTVLLPEVLAKAPPPPPPPLSPPIGTTLQPPPIPVIPTQASPAIRFIPHQLQRQPLARPPVRPNFMGMRGPPMAGPPGPFPPPGSVGPFAPPMGQGPPMPQMGSINPGVPMQPVGPMPPGGPMLPMPPGAMSMPPMPQPMGGMNMGVSLPVPPGFCPPGPPMGSGSMRFDSPAVASSNSTQSSEAESVTSTSTAKSSDSSTVVASAPTIYAAPFVKSLSENKSENLSSNSGHENMASSVSSPVAQKSEKISTAKSSNESTVGPTVPSADKTEETVVSKKKEKKKKLIRMAGGQAWEDNSLQDWDNDDFRIFCGDLGNDVTDEVLIRAFSKYPSFLKAKVIRDKRTNKTKGFGFVSFKDPQDFIKAMREMNVIYDSLDHPNGMLPI